jgi:hypothetical protein
MLSVVLAIVAAACFVFMLIDLSYAIDLDKKPERVEAELEECRRNRRVSHNPSAFPDRTVVEGYPPEHETTNLCASTERRRA